jgi:hypothetical protein
MEALYSFQFLLVAAAADLGVLQAVFGALHAAQGADVVGVVAVVAGGVDLGDILLAGWAWTECR